MIPEQQPLLTTSQLAAKWGVRPGTIYDWCYRGLIPHIRIQSGRRKGVIRFRPEDVEEFISARVVEPRRPTR